MRRRRRRSGFQFLGNAVSMKPVVILPSRNCAFETGDTDFGGMFWPQVIRGVAIMFCLLPPTHLALGAPSETQVPDASGLFNLMRNLGSAIGIALIDTILYGRTSIHALRNRLLAGDMTAATAIGLEIQTG
jgi:MFS transporter, DHA2 family, multidrug resistance protein